MFEHAILNFKTERNPAAILKRWAELPAVVNRPHLEESEVSRLIDAMDAYAGYITTKLAAKFLLLTFVRKTELVQAQWTEIDVEGKKWVIPPERMKMKDAHIVPLSDQALALIKELQTIHQDSIYLFSNSGALGVIDVATRALRLNVLVEPCKKAVPPR